MVEFLDRVLAGMDEDVSAEITRLMEANGVRILTSHKVQSVKDGVLTAENQKTGEEVKIDCQHDPGCYRTRGCSARRNV